VVAGFNQLNQGLPRHIGFHHREDLLTLGVL
jgi:hypothetical protein